MNYSKIKKIVKYSKEVSVKTGINAAINQFELFQQAPTLHSMPLIVDVVLTKICNLKCIFCKDYETPGPKQISVENFEKIARQLFPTAIRVNMCSGGEPYTHKNLIDLLRITKRYNVSTWLLSNGMLLKEDIVRTIIKEELVTRHGFSVDGIKASTVESIRLNAKLNVILENIKMLIRIRKEEGKQKPDIVIRYALMLSNIKELPEAVRYWGELGINALDCSYLSLCNEIDRNESLYFHQDLMKEVFKEAKEIAAQYPHLTLKLPLSVIQEKPKQQKPVKCVSPWRFVAVGIDGQIRPCYKSWVTNNMGNLYTDDNNGFKKIWNSPYYQKLRRSVNSDKYQKHNSYCSVCESRYGMGTEAAHLGDETWMKHIQDPSEKAQIQANRSRSRNKITPKSIVESLEPDITENINN